jgi:hypothetical protein
MSTLFTVNLDGNFRTGDGAEGTTCAVIAFFENNRSISPGVIFLGGDNTASLACMNA